MKLTCIANVSGYFTLCIFYENVLLDFFLLLGAANSSGLFCSGLNIPHVESTPFCAISGEFSKFELLANE